MVCTFSKEFSASAFTSVENTFILEYLPIADGNAVKVYLYGLFLCQNNNFDVPLEEMAKHLSMTDEEVVNAFLYWQEFDLVTVTQSPFSVIYQPISKVYSKAKRYKPEKYTEFCAELQQLFPNKAIGVSEYSEYFSIMEIYSIRQDAMLMIVRYCIERKGDSIGYKYISKVAKDFGSRGINTVEKVDDEISKYVSRTAELEKILKALGSTKAPDIENLKFLNKWTNELGFNFESILHAAKSMKKGSFEKLDAFIMELYGLKCFTIEEIDNHVGKKKVIFDTSIKIAKSLSLYFEVIDTVVDNYTSKWFDMGYREDGLLYIANYCFKQGKNSLENMDKLIDFLFKNGLISFDAIGEYFLTREKDDEFISTLLETLGIKRTVTSWDRDNLKTWREWNFSDDMITYAVKKAVGKTSPMPYVNAILGSWKTKNIFTIEDADKDEKSSSANSSVKTNGRPTGVTVERVSAKYEEYRYNANEIAKRNLLKAEELEGFKELYDTYNSLDIKIAMAQFGHASESVEDLEKEKHDTHVKLIALLKKAKLTISDLKPKFKCNKCNDTGFDGTSKCSCYEDVVAECQKEL